MTLALHWAWVAAPQRHLSSHSSGKLGTWYKMMANEVRPRPGSAEHRDSHPISLWPKLGELPRHLVHLLHSRRKQRDTDIHLRLLSSAREL